jgi:hypothetical protein
LPDREKSREKRDGLFANQLAAHCRHLDSSDQATVTKYRWREGCARLAAASGGRLPQRENERAGRKRPALGVGVFLG